MPGPEAMAPGPSSSPSLHGLGRLLIFEVRLPEHGGPGSWQSQCQAAENPRQEGKLMVMNRTPTLS